MQKKLMFVTRSLSGGGAERVISNLANHFSMNGYDVTLVCLDKQDIRYAVSPHLRLIELTERKLEENIFTRIYYSLTTFFKLLRVIREEQPYCCISFMTSVNVWTGICCILLNKKYIVSERTSPFYTIKKLNKLHQWIVYHIYRKAKAVVSPSQRMSNSFSLIKHYSKLRNFVAIYNPVNTFIQPTMESVYPRSFILSVGRLDPCKGFDVLIEAFSQLSPYPIDLLISGVGEEKTLLEQKIKAYNLQSRIKFIGFKSNLQDYYSQAKIFVMASRVEGYPNALVEALSLGCSVVATDCEFGPSEIVENGVNGFLVQVDDSKELASAIETLIKDDSLRIKFSQNAKRINKTNSLESIADQWNNLILS